MVLLYGSLPGYGAEEPHEAHIRLLHLKPSPNRNSPIKISLEVAPLATSTEYEALSYVWGDQAKEAVRKAIKCDNTTVDATKNLVAALKHIRFTDRDRVLWVDAICINQQDVHEKSQQVAIMGSIFTRAKRVLIWLGPAADESDVAIRYVNKLFGELSCSPSELERRSADKSYCDMGVDFVAIRRRFAQSAIPCTNQREDEGAFQTEPAPPTSDEFAALGALLRRRWWGRVWIIQELCLAKEAILVCGNSSAPWDALAFAIARTVDCDFSNDDEWVLPSLREILMFSSLSRTRCRLSSLGSRLGLFEALGMFRWFHATDSRDKVYALLGMVEDACIVPDYDVSQEKCYTETARKILSSSDTLDILDSAAPPYPFERPVDLPSWVPDWGQDDNSDKYGILGRHALSVRFIFSENRPEQSAQICQRQLRYDEKGTLILKGMRIDHVEAVEGVIRVPFPATPRPATVTSNRVRRFLSQRLWFIKVVLIAVGAFYHFGKFLTCRENSLEFAELASLRVPGQERQEQDFRIHSFTRLISLCARDDVDLDNTTAEDLAKLHIAMWDNITNSGVHRFLKRFAISRRFPTLYYYLLGILALGEDNYEDFCVFMVGDGGRCLARSRGGRLCSTPHTSRAGDQIALLHGGRHPYVIREAGDRWELVGPCYFSREEMDELRVLWADEEAVEIAFK